ncbi:MAG: hypothetical protein JWQ09_1821 [Segetibacter sp.]|nr:hypothetical protein [Segetibacter sp.]
MFLRLNLGYYWYMETALYIMGGYVCIGEGRGGPLKLAAIFESR